MGILFASVEVMVYLLWIGVVGFLILAKKLVVRAVVQVLSPLVVTLSVLCLVFSDIVSTVNPSRVPGCWPRPLLWIGLTPDHAADVIAAGRWVQTENRREFKRIRHQ